MISRAFRMGATGPVHVAQLVMRGTLEHTLHLSAHPSSHPSLSSLDGGRCPGRSPGPDAGGEGDAPCSTCAEEEEEEVGQGQQSDGGASSSRTASRRPDRTGTLGAVVGAVGSSNDERIQDGSLGSEVTLRNEPLSVPLGTAHGKRRVADAPPPVSAKRLRFDHTFSSEGQETERGVRPPFGIPLNLPLGQAECMIKGQDASQEVVSSQRPIALTTARGDEAKVHNLLRSMTFLR